MDVNLHNVRALSAINCVYALLAAIICKKMMKNE